MKMKDMLAQLLDILSRETELYQTMSQVMKKEKDAAIQSQLSALNEAQIEKENILAVLRRLEEQRRNLVAVLADTLGHSARDMNLTKIAELVGEPFAGRLKQAKSDLSALLESIQVANRHNRHLFEHSRDLLRGSINLLSALRSPNPIYHSTGVVQNMSASGKCVCDDI